LLVGISEAAPAARAPYPHSSRSGDQEFRA